jgi:uncharacterized membrane protein YdjX (TVP38/TMEM64 family)
MMNLLAGALFGIKVSFIVCVLCNTLGATICFLISKYFLGNIQKYSFTKNHVQNFKNKLQNK